MSAERLRAATPRLALRVAEAAAALGVSEDFFGTEIAPELPCVRRGRLKLYSVRALEEWLERNGEHVLGGRAS